MAFTRRIAVSCAAALVAASLTAPVASAQSNYPERQVTWLIPFGAGGGTDSWARTAGRMMNELGITDATFIYENRPGGSGVRAFMDLLNQYEGNDHILFPFQDLVIVPELEGTIEQNYEDMTVIGIVALDRHFLLVNGESEHQTVDDLIAASQDEQVVLAVGSSGRFPAHLLMEASELDARMARFEGDAEIVQNLVGGHVDAAFANPSEVAGQLESGALRALAVAGPERLEAYPEVPTFQEEGFEGVNFALFRGVGMPPGVSPEAVEYWTEAFEELSASDEWKTEYLDVHSLDGQFLDEEAFVQMAEEDLLPTYRKVMELESQ